LLSINAGRIDTRNTRLHCLAKSGPALSNKAYNGIVGSFKVIAEESEDVGTIRELDSRTIRLLDVGSGWGNGAHPTTRLCLDFVAKSVRNGDSFLDYGTGSGILSIAAAKLGASHCVAVDIDEDTLRAAEKNAEVNGVAEKLDVVHTKYVYIGEDRFPICDVTVANILPVSDRA
jgi:ribosomal protein L11 methylase PrmA